MRIEIRGRNTAVTDALREHVEERFAQGRQAGLRAGPARRRAAGREEPRDRRRQGRRGDAPPEGRHAAGARGSADLEHSIDLWRTSSPARSSATATSAAARREQRRTGAARRSRATRLSARAAGRRGPAASHRHSHGPETHRPRPAHGRGGAVQGATRSASSASTRSSPRWSCSRTTSSARRPTRCASAPATASRSTTCCYEAFALCREAGRRTLGMRHFDVQLIGGMVLHDGSIAEMKTGEGKTLVATLPIFLNSLGGESVHLVTVNDYLARRDAEWMRPLYDALGVTVGVIQNMQSFEDKQVAYAGRRHLRHQLRVRLRLPARQHGRRRSRRSCSAAIRSGSSTRSTTS